MGFMVIFGFMLHRGGELLCIVPAQELVVEKFYVCFQFEMYLNARILSLFIDPLEPSFGYRPTDICYANAIWEHYHCTLDQYYNDMLDYLIIAQDILADDGH